jgi:hypothetical protein
MVGLTKKHFQDKIFPAGNAVGHRNAGSQKEHQSILTPRRLQALKIAPIDIGGTDSNGLAPSLRPGHLAFGVHCSPFGVRRLAFGGSGASLKTVHIPVYCLKLLVSSRQIMDGLG